MRVVVVVLIAVVAGCGASGSSPSRTSPTTCKDVLLDRAQDVHASEIRAVGTDCRTAQRVAFEWGRQNVGGPGAHLPGWKCGAGGACRKGAARVTWTLAYP